MTILGMSLGAWITAGVLVVVIAGLVRGRIGPDLLLLSGLVALLATGTLEAREAVRGFANPAVVTVGFLYIVAAGLKETGALTMLATPLLGDPKTLRGAQMRLTAPVAVASAFVNNTPIVAMFLPQLTSWAKRTGLDVSGLFMPLSFAAILGGMCTLIGTSTNIVVNELILEEIERVTAGEVATGPAPGAAIATAEMSLQGFGMFTLAWVGVPIALAGLGYMLLFGRSLLRSREEDVPLDEEAREYMVAMRVEPGAAITGKSVEDAGLRRLPGLFLSRIDRAGETIIAVGPEQVLQGGDVLIFVGRLDSVVDLQKIRGLSPMTGEAGRAAATPRHSARLTEVVVSRTCPLIGRTIREGSFRTRYDAVVIAVHRNGERLGGKIGDIRLRTGDTLLLEAAPGFAKRFRDSRDFFLVNELPGSAAPRHGRAWIAIAILAGLVAVIAARPESAMTAAMGAALAMVLFRCCTGPDARAAVDWQVLVVIGSTFGLAAAMQKTGLAEVIASGLLALGGQLGTHGLLAVVFLVTAVFTAVITNNAAAVLMFPIALEAAADQGAAFTPVAVTIAIAASAGFATPLAYQTNLMVMGPGGYKTMDFVRFGVPLTLMVGLLTVVLAPIAYG